MQLLRDNLVSISSNSSFSVTKLTVLTRPSGPRPRPSLRVTLPPRPRSPLRHPLPPRRPRHPSKSQSNIQISYHFVENGGSRYHGKCEQSNPGVVSFQQNSIMGRAKERWFFSFFFYPLKSIFLFLNPPSLLSSPLHGTRTDLRKLPLGSLRVGEWRG